jgi:hypothetical protein
VAQFEKDSYCALGPPRSGPYNQGMAENEKHSEDSNTGGLRPFLWLAIIVIAISSGFFLAKNLGLF